MAMRNFNTAMQLYSALNMTPIERLKFAWAALSRTDLAIFETVSYCLLDDIIIYISSLIEVFSSSSRAS